MDKTIIKIKKEISSGFTLVEILITLTIVGIMAVVAIPAMNKAQERQTFETKMEELRAAILEMGAKASNPEQNINSYLIEYTSASQNFSFHKRHTIDGLLLYKELIFPSSDFTISLTAYNGFFPVISCSNNTCCHKRNISAPYDCSGTDLPLNINTKWIMIISSQTSQTAHFYLGENPFRVNLIIDN